MKRLSATCLGCGTARGPPLFPSSTKPRSPPLQLLLGEVYAGQAAAGRRYRLRCMAGFYGQHYVALIRLPELEGQ